MSKRRKFSAEFKRRPKRVRAWREQGRLSCRRTWRRKNESLVERLHRDSASRCALWPFVLRSSHVSPLPGRYAYWMRIWGYFAVIFLFLQLFLALQQWWENSHRRR